MANKLDDSDQITVIGLGNMGSALDTAYWLRDTRSLYGTEPSPNVTHWQILAQMLWAPLLKL